MSRPRTRPRLATWLLAIMAAGVVAVAFVVPAVLSSRLEAALRDDLGGGRVNVRVQGAPWRLLAGSFTVLEVEARGAVINQLPVERLFLRLREARVDLGRLFRENTLVLASVGGGEGEVTLTRENLERYLSGSKGMQRAVVGMEGGVITIEGDVRVGDLDLRARLVGRLVIASPRTLDLHVQELTVSGVEIPREVGALLVASFNPLVNLEGLPLPARIASVAVESGQATIMVRVDRP